MSKSSAAISLVLLGTASAAFVGYKAVSGPHRPAGAVQPTGFTNGGSDFVQGDGPADGQGEAAFDPAGTQPTTGPTTNQFAGSGTGHSNTYHSYAHSSHTGTWVYSGSSGSNSYAGTPSRRTGSGSTASGSSGSSAGTSHGESGESAHSAGTSRGGFGSTGHAVGHASE